MGRGNTTWRTDFWWILLLLVLTTVSPSFGNNFSEDQKTANNLLYTGKFADSLAMSEDIAQRAEAAGDSNSLAIALLQISEGHYYLGQRELTLPPLQQALQIYEALNDFEGIGRSHYSIAYYYERTDPSRMIEILKTAGHFAQQACDDKLEMNIANATGVALWGIGKYEQAVVALENSIALAQKNNWDSARAASLQNIALIHYNQGRPEEALAFNNKALIIFKNEKATHSYAVGLGNSGNAYRDLREFEKGLACYEEALSIHRGNGALRGVAINLNNIADVYLALQEWDQARAFLLEAMAIHQEMENYRDLLLSYSSLGNLALSQGKNSEAKDFFLQSLDLGDKLGDPYLLDGPEISLAIIELEDGKPNQAEMWLDRAEKHARLAGKPPSLGIILSLRAKLEARDENWALAVKTMGKAIAIHEQIRLRTYTYHWHTLLARYLAATGDQLAARQHFDASLELVSHLDAMIATDRFRVGFFQDVSLIYHQYAVWLARQGDVAGGMAMLDQGRSRVLALRLLQNHGLKGFSPEQHATLNRISMLQRKLRQEVETNEGIEEILKLLEAAEWDYEKASGAKMVEGLTNASVGLTGFDESVLHLSYSSQNDTLVVFSLYAGQTRIRMIPDAETILSRARMYADLMASPNSGPRFKVAGHGLCQVLMGPELSGFNGDRILINPDSDLWTFPFVALVSSQDRFLGEVASIGLTPSWNVLQTLSNRPAPIGNRALVLANSNFSTGLSLDRQLENLDSVKLEAQNVSSHFHKATILFNASESAFKTLPLDQFDPLHFATHTLTDVDHPLRSSIVLELSPGEDGLLQAREIQHLPLDCNLVVVSGCKSGAGKVVLGEGLLGVAHSLMRAGSRCVVMSRWDVTDEGAAKFMDELYQALEEHPVNKAVTIAQQKLRQSEQWSHPYYWAPFYVAGDGDVRLQNCERSNNAKSLYAIGIAGLLGVFSGLMLLLRKRK